MAELETLQMLIDGQWCAASDGAAFDCIDPTLKEYCDPHLSQV